MGEPLSLGLMNYENSSMLCHMFSLSDGELDLIQITPSPLIQITSLASSASLYGLLTCSQLSLMRNKIWTAGEQSVQFSLVSNQFISSN